jgi:serine/threonine-protein kinase RsbW
MSSSEHNVRRILGRVNRNEFVGRADELARVVSYPRSRDGGLLLLLAPSAGVSELLRQAYDELFAQREHMVPIYFALTSRLATPVTVAIEFLNTFLLQYVAFQRNEPALAQTSLLLEEIVKLAPPSDLEWIESVVATYKRTRFSDNDDELIRLCLTVADRVPRNAAVPFVMLDTVGASGSNIAAAFLSALNTSRLPFVFAGLRRQVLAAADEANCSFERLRILRLEKLDAASAQQLVEFAAARVNVETNDETRDLLVQQFDCSPYFLTRMLKAAHDKNVSLTNFIACEQLYVDELLGGFLNRHYDGLLEQIAAPEIRRSLLRVLFEATVSDEKKASFDSWRKLLAVSGLQLREILHALHGQEFINWNGGVIESGGGPTVWRDYLKAHYRLEVANENRAMVVADSLATALKRAPHTMAAYYRRVSRLSLKDLLRAFNAQLVPRMLFQYEQFTESYRGATEEEILRGLDAETDLIRLPQVFHVASCSAFDRNITQVADDDSCIVAHAFEGDTYSDANEIVLLAAQFESKLEAEKDIVEAWLDRLDELAENSGFARYRIVLIAENGFSTEALRLVELRNAQGVSRQQFELLSARINAPRGGLPASTDEFVTILPMGGDNELVAAGIVEQIARRAHFEPEAINQIKTAIVEACINAAEHSLSPDRKIYQRFSVDHDKLVVTISSRGVVPAKRSISENNRTAEALEPSEGRRGWGLKLIRSLMDEVEFEKVDDGTSLRMTKYLRHGPS